MQIDLKPPTMRKKRPETIYNDLKKTYNVEETTCKEQKRDSKQPTTSRYLDYFAIWGNYVFNSTFDCNHLSMASWRIIMEIAKYLYIMYYHVHLLRDIKFAGYFANDFDTCKLPFASKKATFWLSLTKKSNFGIDKTFKALKMVAWQISAHHINIHKALCWLYFSFQIELKGFQISRV